MTTPDKSPGRPKTITSELEYEIILYTTENPRATLSQIKLNLELDVSEMAISKKLKANDLSCRVARRKLSINGNQRACRLQFVNNYIDFTEWNRTIFVDESTFETCYKTRELVRRPTGSAFNEKYVTNLQKTGKRNVSVFGLMTAHEFGPLIRIENTFTAEQYCNILNETVLPYIEEHFGDHFYFYQDNSPIHKASRSMNWFRLNFPPDQLLPVPPRSADLNPIEHAWHRAKVMVKDENGYNSSEDLWLAICDAWNDLRRDHQWLARNLVDSMPRRLYECGCNNGGITSY